MAIIALNAPSGRGHYRRLISADLFENGVLSYFLSSSQGGNSTGSVGEGGSASEWRKLEASLAAKSWKI